MRRAVLVLGFLLPVAACADTVYFDTGRVWQGVEVVDAKQRISSALVLIEPMRVTIKRGWHSGVVHIEFGDKPTSPEIAFKSPHRPIVGIVQRTVDGDTLKLATGERLRLIGVDTPESVDPRRPVEIQSDDRGGEYHLPTRTPWSAAAITCATP